MTLILSGTNGLSDVDGSAATPAIRGTDTNTGMFFPAADTIGFAEGGAEVARFDSSGNLGLGTTTPNTAGYGGAVLGIYGGSNTGGNIWLTSDTTAAGNRAGRIGFGTEGNSTNKEIARVWSLAAGSTAGNLGGDLLFSTKPDGGALTERARITSGGQLLIGTTTAGAGIGFTTKVAIDASGDFGMVVKTSNAAYECINTWNSATSGTRYHMYFRDGASASARGSITTDGANTAYNTSSDYRLKDNPQPLTGSGAFIDALKPKTWIWKETGATGVGFIAHEVQEVSPGSVTGTKDAVDEEGNPIMQGMEYGSAEFIANIIAELQALRQRVAALESGAK